MARSAEAGVSIVNLPNKNGEKKKTQSKPCLLRRFPAESDDPSRFDDLKRPANVRMKLNQPSAQHDSTRSQHTEILRQ